MGDQVSRLLDDLSDQENVAAQEPINNEEVVCEVEDLLQLAMDERKGKLEAIKVLAELKQNYDQLQKKFAAAETTIDKLRFGSNDGVSESQSEQNEITEENPAENQGSSLATLHYKLIEVQDQLYGLEILSSDLSSFSSLDKKATLTKLRVTYDSIKKQTTRVPNANSEYLRCLSEVGEKLYVMEKQEEPPDFAWQNCPSEQARPQEPESDGRG